MPDADLARFYARLPYTLQQENNVYTGTAADWSNPKNFDNDPRDPGGRTQCGILQREYDIYRKAKGLSVHSVTLMTQAEGEDIYHAYFWKPYCSLLPSGLDLSFFDASVNEGTHEAIRILQVALGIASDGAWGPQTLGAVQAIGNVTGAITAFTARRAAVYRLMPGDKYFDADWERRTREIGAQSLKLAEAA